MRNRIKSHLLYGRHFCGIEHTTKNGDAIIYCSVLKQSAKELNIATVFEAQTVQEVTNKLSKNQHLVLVLNNEKVLFKTIESEQQEAQKLVYKAFPNINLEDFYFEVLSQKSIHFVALCRKDYVNSLVELYAKQKRSVIAISLGNNLIDTVSSFINGDSLYSSNAKIKLEGNQVIHIEKDTITAENYDINGLTISNDHLLSFSGALQTVLKSNTTKNNFVEEKNNLLNDYKQTHFFNQFLKIGGLLILGLLLVNFFVFNHYFNKVNELKQVSEINQSTKSRIVKLNASVSKKQKMVEDLLKSNSSKTSFYSDRIINSLPKSILLTEFNYQPLLKRIKADKEISLDENSISVSGASNNSEVFSSWISQLEQNAWVNKVNINDYGTSSSKASEFKIKIILNDE